MWRPSLFNCFFHLHNPPVVTWGAVKGVPQGTFVWTLNSSARRFILSPNVSQSGRVAAKSSSSRRRRQVKIRKSSYGPSAASCWPSSPRGFRFLVRERHTTPPRLGCAAQLVSLLPPLSSAELQLATAGAPGEIVPGEDSRSTATPRFCVP